MLGVPDYVLRAGDVFLDPTNGYVYTIESFVQIQSYGSCMVLYTLSRPDFTMSTGARDPKDFADFERLKR